MESRRVIEPKKIYYKKVYPKDAQVIAEICYEKEINNIEGDTLRYEEVVEISRKVGMDIPNTWPLAADYKKANDWADEQLDLIKRHTTEEVEGVQKRPSERLKPRGPIEE